MKDRGLWEAYMAICEREGISAAEDIRAYITSRVEAHTSATEPDRPATE